MEEVEAVLDKVDEDTALHLVDLHGIEHYVIRENGVPIFVYKHEGRWIKVLYSNLTEQYRNWIGSDDCSFVPREKVPVDKLGCIGRYCSGDEIYQCRKCGREIEGGKPFALHLWNEHGITSDPRSYRDPARGQMSLGERWSS